MRRAKFQDGQLTTRVRAKFQDELFAVIQEEDQPFHRILEIVLRRGESVEKVFESLRFLQGGQEEPYLFR